MSSVLSWFETGVLDEEQLVQSFLHKPLGNQLSQQPYSIYIYISYLHIYIYMFFLHVYIYSYIYTQTHTHIYIYIFVLGLVIQSS